MVGAIKGCTGKEPIVVGKPSALMIDYIVDKYKVLFSGIVHYILYVYDSIILSTIIIRSPPYNILNAL